MKLFNIFNFFNFLDFSKYVEVENNCYERISIILLCENSVKKNFPPTQLITSLTNIIESISSIKWETNEIIFYKPSFFFKVWILFLRFFINKNVWDQISFISNEVDINNNFDFSNCDNIHEFFSR